MNDQQRYWADLCAMGPVVFAPEGIHGRPAYYLTRREDILAVLLDPETILLTDRGVPAGYRRVALSLLAPHALNEHMPAQLLQRIAAVIEVATYGVAHGLELTLPDIGNTLSEQVFLALAGIADGRELPHAVAERRTPFLAGLSDTVDDADVISVVEWLVHGGYESLSTALQTAFGDLYRNPELVDKLCADPHRIADFVDDLLRHESPHPTLVWHTTRATTVAGVLIPPGSRVELCVGAASVNQGSGHLEFGAGTHRCPGRHLAKLALTVCIQEWVTLQSFVRFQGQSG